jgi:hypothetical protein
VVFERASRLEFLAPAQPLATTASGNPLYSKLDRAEGSVLVFQACLDRDFTDLPLRPDFVQLVQNGVRWLAGVGTQDWQADREVRSSQTSTLTSQAFRTHARATTADVVRLEAGQSIRRPGEQEAVAAKVLDGPLVALEEVGLWKLTAGDSSVEPMDVQVNMVNRAESALVRVESLAGDELPLAEPVSDQPIWMLLAGVAVVLLAVEWCLYHRRVLV